MHTVQQNEIPPNPLVQMTEDNFNWQYFTSNFPTIRSYSFHKISVLNRWNASSTFKGPNELLQIRIFWPFSPNLISDLFNPWTHYAKYFVRDYLMAGPNFIKYINFYGPRTTRLSRA